jgi:hypothetical protein
MRKSITLLAILALLTPLARADDAPADVTAQLRHGLRMKLVPPPAPKPASDGEDPLADITNKMTDIVGDLADLKTNQPVQDKQKQVVSQLDEIIAQIEKQKSKSGSGGGKNPTKPLPDSVIASGPGGIGDLRDPKSGTRNLNNLPAKQRDAILQSKTEGFPPGYEALLQSYYQRLAQEKVGDEAAASPATKSPNPAAP